MKSIQSVLLVATLILGLGGCLNSAKSMFQKTLTRAEDGDAKSQWYLGVMYETGTEVSKDYKKATKWFRLAANQGFAPAQFNLALNYDLGHGVLKDYVKAHKWLSLAATQGHNMAIITLAPSMRYVEAHKSWDLVAKEGYSSAVMTREWEMAKKMTPSQIQEAHRLARNFKPKKN